jgi:hypothetical protein
LGRELIEEVESFEKSGLPVMRPNSMNNYGLILDEIGFTPMLDDLRTKYIIPFSSILYPQVGGASLDYHHGFIVRILSVRAIPFPFTVANNTCLTIPSTCRFSTSSRKTRSWTSTLMTRR